MSAPILLDNLTDMKEVEKLSDKQLGVLYRLTVLDPSFNVSKHDNQRYGILALSEKLKGKVSRKEMLGDMDIIIKNLKEYNNKYGDPHLTPRIINEIKLHKAEDLIIACETNTSHALTVEEKVPEMIIDLQKKMNEQKDLYVLKGMAATIVERLRSRGINSIGNDKNLEEYVFNKLEAKKSNVIEVVDSTEGKEKFEGKFLGKMVKEHEAFVEARELGGELARTVSTTSDAPLGGRERHSVVQRDAGVKRE